MPKYTYGGQALIEGVLMRGRDAIAVALRHPDGSIAWATERLDSGFHGAEHMTIHALEAGDPLTTDEVRKYPTAHQRCGTEFLVVVIALSIVAFALVGKQSAIVMVGSRIVLIPVIASVGYEILRAGARYRRNRLVHAILLPGLWVQMITTKRPTDDMIRVAIVSMEEALVADGEAVPAGSEPIRREPIF